MVLKDGSNYLCIKDFIDDRYFGSCWFFEGNTYKCYNENSLIDENGSHIFFPPEGKYNLEEYFKLKEDEAV